MVTNIHSEHSGIFSERVQHLFTQLGDIDLLTNFLEDNPLAVVLTDSKGFIVYVNNQLLNISGYESHELIGQKPDKFKSGEQPAEFYKRLWDTIETGEQFESRFKNRRKDNSFYWVYSTIRPLRLRSGKIVGYISIQEDITNLVSIESNSYANEAVLVNLMRDLPKTGIFLCEGASPFVKIAEGEIVQEFFSDKMPDLEAVSSFFSAKEFDFRQTVLDIFSRGGVQRKKLKLSKRTFDIRISAISFGRSSKKYCTIIIRDISDYQYVIEKVQQSEQQLEAIFQNAGIGIGILNTVGDYIRVNSGWAQMIGYDISELLRFNVKMLVHSEDYAKHYPDFEKMGKGIIHAHRIELRFIKKDGTVLWGDVSMSVLKKRRGQVEAIIAVVSDITKSKIMLDALEQSKQEYKALNETKDRLFSILAHDLRNPFNSIIGLSELAVEFPQETTYESAMEFLKSINTTANQAYNLLENLLEWSRIQSGSIEPVRVHIDIYELVEDVVNLLKTMARNKNVVVKNLVSPQTFIVGDIQMMNTVLRNLITNAVKYSFADGEVNVSADFVDETVELKVRDFGVGMSNELLASVVSRNKVVSELGTNNEKGTGLGMGLVFDFVKMNGGKVIVKSAKGKGASISVVLPRKR